MSKNRILGNLNRPLHTRRAPGEDIQTPEYTGENIPLTFGVAFGIAAGLGAATDQRGNPVESQQDTLKAASVWNKLWDAHCQDDDSITLTADEIEILRKRVHRRWNSPEFFAALDEELDIAKDMTPEKHQKKEAMEGGEE